MQLILLTPQQLQEYFDEFARKIEAILKDSQNKVISNEWLTSKEVCDLLKISLTTLHDWSNKGILKKHKVANRIRFRYDEVLESLQKIESKNRKK